MERYRYPRHIPYYPAQVALVDQYSWQKKDTNKYHGVNNGIAYPIYASQGHISSPVPLEEYTNWPGHLHQQSADVKKRIGHGF